MIERDVFRSRKPRTEDEARAHVVLSELTFARESSRENQYPELTK